MVDISLSKSNASALCPSILRFLIPAPVSKPKTLSSFVKYLKISLNSETASTPSSSNAALNLANSAGSTLSLPPLSAINAASDKGTELLSSGSTYPAISINFDLKLLLLVLIT